ncbi:hypothetical protein BGZ76_002615 [Entomortierella beljakovae]|nr:hypothetical protein BGZ76_002615 [Entomortierella beljakovae]
MGLKQVRFIDWFQSNFPNSVRSVPDNEGAYFDSVFIDINCILHPSVRAATNESMFVKKLYSILDKLLAQFTPSRICYLSVDGPAPVAKINTQKARRSAKGSRKSKTGGMSTLQVTPGCPFMTRLEHYLSYYSVRYLQHRQALGISPDLKFVIDHSNNPGEGESKIIENIVQQTPNIRGRPCAIISMDSDAVLQAVALGIQNVYVVRKDSPANPAVVISIDKFMRELETRFPGESNRTRLDFCALCLFRGNDYLRSIYVGLDKLWKSYLFTKLVDPEITQRGALKFLIDAEQKTFDLYFLRRMIFNSYKHPTQLQLPDHILRTMTQQDSQQNSQQNSQGDFHQNSPDLEHGSEALKSTVNNMENLAIKNESDTESSDEKGGENEDTGNHSDRELKNGVNKKNYSAKKFLEGVLWNLEAYCSGTCPDISFCYEFQVAPPRRELTTFINSISNLKQHASLLPTTTSEILTVSRSDTKYLHPLVCGLILLPPGIGSAFLPQSIAPFHSELISSESENLTQDEMEAIDNKVSKLIEILESSGKGHDANIAKELSGLYLTRDPYIWTRLRVVNPGSRPSAIPASPNVIIDQLISSQAIDTHNASSTSATTTTAQQLHMFSDLQQQPDIRRITVKVPPNVVQSHNLEANTKATPARVGNTNTPWESMERQQAVALALKAPATQWPFHFRGNLHRRIANKPVVAATTTTTTQHKNSNRDQNGSGRKDSNGTEQKRRPKHNNQKTSATENNQNHEKKRSGRRQKPMNLEKGESFKEAKVLQVPDSTVEG